MVNITGISKALVLAALFNAAKPIEGQDEHLQLTEEAASAAGNSVDWKFDTLNGRKLNVNLADS